MSPLMKLKRYTEAVEAYEKAFELDLTVILNYDDFMWALQALGRKGEAERIHARTRQPGYEDQEYDENMAKMEYACLSS